MMLGHPGGASLNVEAVFACQAFMTLSFQSPPLLYIKALGLFLFEERRGKKLHIRKYLKLFPKVLYF